MTESTGVQRTYIFVPPEERSEVEVLGAHWDADAKCWYIDADANAEAGRFSRWLADDESDDEYRITSNTAYVAAAHAVCDSCAAPMEVICIHCASGTVSNEPLKEFTVSNIWAMDDELARQLHRWPAFRRVDDPGVGSYFANHCARCGVEQQDILLHSEPDQPFFDIAGAPPGDVALTPLSGPISLSGDEHFLVS